MKKALFLLLSVIACVAGTVSCKKLVEYVYPSTYVFNNPTDHTIAVKIESHYTPMEFTITPKGSYSKLWVVGEGPISVEFETVDVIFDDSYNVLHKRNEENKESRNMCDVANYVTSADSEHEHGTVYTFTFTEADYEYAVSAGGSGKDGN